jgi:diguanylate cyclase (GGDEF)-like protein
MVVTSCPILIYWLESTKGEPVSFIFADVDDFGAFNKKYSYKVGDAVLRNAFTIARRLVGNRGGVYRFGGEEIVALLPYCDLDLSKTVAESIRSEVANTVISFEGQDFHATLSIGVAASPPCDRDGPALEAHAENALKRAKSEGKNRVRMAE